MWKKTVFAFSALLAAAALSSTSLAVTTAASNGMGDEKKPSFEEADANNDGRVSMSEATSAGIPNFEAKGADIDEDGLLTKQDWTFVDIKGAVDMEAEKASF